MNLQLKKLLYSHHSQIWDYFVHNEIEELLIIVPNPVFADAMRKQITSLQLSEKIKIDTISHFTKNNVKQFVPNEFNENYSKNSDLFLTLSLIWDKQGFGSFHEYQKCFKLLTDLRSFSLDVEVFHEYFEFLEEDIVKQVIFLWKLLEQAQIWDEQYLYKILKEVEFSEQTKFCFMGFDFLSANQVDFINELAASHPVYIPFPVSTHKIVNNLDWIDWLMGAEIILEMSEPKTDMRVIKFEQGNLFENYLQYLNDEQKLGRKYVVMADSQAKFEDEIQFMGKEMSLKSPVDIFFSEWSIIEKDLGQELMSKELKVDDFVTLLEDRIEVCISQKKIKLLKIYSDFIELIENIKSKFDNFNKINFFHFQSLIEVLKMNMPRINLITRSEDKSQYTEQRSFKNIAIPLQDNDEIIYIIKKSFSDFSSYREFDESLYKLAPLGPVRRYEFEHEYKRANFINSLQCQKGIVLIEDGVLEEKINWQQVISELDPSELDKHIEKKDFSRSHKNFDEILYKKEKKSFSASSIQMYSDCPRRYYLSYVEGYKVDVETSMLMTPRDEGIILHDVLGQYYSKYKDFNEQSLLNLINGRVDIYIKEKKKKISLLEQEALELKIFVLSENVLIKMMPLKNNPYIEDVLFEKKILEESVDAQFIGYIDIIIKTEDGHLIFDLKRSSGSIPTIKSFNSYEALQLWFYASHWGGEDLLGIGYLCATDMEKSIFFSEHELSKELCLTTGMARVPRTQKFSDSLIEGYKKYEVGLINEIQSKENKFLPTPIKSSYCDYCQFTSICSRGEVL